MRNKQQQQQQQQQKYSALIHVELLLHVKSSIAKYLLKICKKPNRNEIVISKCISISGKLDETWYCSKMCIFNKSSRLKPTHNINGLSIDLKWKLAKLISDFSEAASLTEEKRSEDIFYKSINVWDVYTFFRLHLIVVSYEIN